MGSQSDVGLTKGCRRTCDVWHRLCQVSGRQVSAEAFPFDAASRYLSGDGDGKYGERVSRWIEGIGIDEVITAPVSPWQNAYVERVIGTLRRELFDHVIVLNERHLKQWDGLLLTLSFLRRCARMVSGNQPFRG